MLKDRGRSSKSNIIFHIICNINSAELTNSISFSIQWHCNSIQKYKIIT